MLPRFGEGGPAAGYNGRNRTFFFVNWEQYRAGANVIADAVSVPTADYRKGDFSKALLIQPDMAYCVAGKVNSADKLYLVIESVRLDTKHIRSSTVPDPADGAGGLPLP